MPSAPVPLVSCAVDAALKEHCHAGLRLKADAVLATTCLVQQGVKFMAPSGIEGDLTLESRLVVSKEGPQRSLKFLVAATQSRTVPVCPAQGPYGTPTAGNCRKVQYEGNGAVRP